MLEEFEWVTVTLAFVVPGFVSSAVIGLFLPRKVSDEKAQLLRYFILTLLTFSLFAGVAWVEALWREPGKSLSGWGLATYFLIIPLILGLIIGVAGRADWLGKTVGRLGFKTIHALPTAWDYRFAHITNGSFVIVKTSEGVFAGFFGGGSFAGEASDKDIYLELVYTIEPNGNWADVQGSEGVWIKGSEIKSIEFRVNS